MSLDRVKKPDISNLVCRLTTVTASIYAIGYHQTAHVTFWNCVKCDNVSNTVQDRDIITRIANKKLYVAYRMVPTLDWLSDLEGHFSGSKLSQLGKYSTFS